MLVVYFNCVCLKVKNPLRPSIVFISSSVKKEVRVVFLAHRLPVDGCNGVSLVAEATVTGRKKEAVVACALEACRLLDVHGLLHASKHGTALLPARVSHVEVFVCI